jgi:very-short-patch-repair endonuclease
MKIYYNSNLKELSRKLRNNQTSAEKALWHALKEKRLSGYDFHRQKPIGNFIYDF